MDDENSLFFIHLDLRTDIAPFKERICGENIFFIEERVGCLWGDFSIVLATINLMLEAKEQKATGFFVLASGQDYPIVSNSEIHSFISQNSQYDFLDVIELEKKWKPKMVKDKLEHYHILHSGKRGHSNCYAPFFHCSMYQKLRTITHLIKGRLSISNFKMLLNLPSKKTIFKQQYAGSQFWALSEKTFYNVIKYIQENEKSLKDYYKYTSSPDEIYFHSIIMNLCNGSYENIKHQITFVNYFRNDNVFLLEDFKVLVTAKNKLLARKFDIDIDSEILQMINSYASR